MHWPKHLQETTPCLLNVNVQVLFLLGLQKFKVPASIGWREHHSDMWTAGFSSPIIYNNLHMTLFPVTFTNNSRNQEEYAAEFIYKYLGKSKTDL